MHRTFYQTYFPSGRAGPKGLKHDPDILEAAPTAAELLHDVGPHFPIGTYPASSPYRSMCRSERNPSILISGPHFRLACL
jgi:hypothetical protein